MGGYKKPRGYSKTHLKKGPFNQLNYENPPKSPLTQNRNKIAKKKKKKINNKVNNLPEVCSNNYYILDEKNQNINYKNNMNNNNTKNINKINKKINPKKKRSVTPLNNEDKNIY